MRRQASLAKAPPPMAVENPNRVAMWIAGIEAQRYNRLLYR
jgi:hypothetical protein